MEMCENRVWRLECAKDKQGSIRMSKTKCRAGEQAVIVEWSKTDLLMKKSVAIIETSCRRSLV